MNLMSLACEVPSKLASLALSMKGRDYTWRRGGVLVEATQFPFFAEVLV